MEPITNPKVVIKKTANRKYISYKSTFSYRGELLIVNAKKSGLYTSVLRKIIEQLDCSLELYKRVLLVRFDLHQEHYTKDNERMTKFKKRLFKRLKKKYETNSIGYVWVREHEKPKTQHYHWAIWIDGDKIRHSKKLLPIIKSIWEDMSGTSPTIKNPYYFIDNSEQRAEAIYRLSYLAKARGKTARPDQTKDYSTSRIR
ncbi:inovirus-type Gp2 protein [Pseudoalteromonas sp. meg-B1]|uniref:YagK/YfjJ domain-containing protein n=1 Tax=Pseudoalteromonas sp. meg-B1 TaxID=2203192 RepID=UPI0015E8610D|nr:inovirus-type Gp2 protein [Pseudoalteromonas sp. meg-B1]